MSSKISRRKFLQRMGAGTAGLAASQSFIGAAMASSPQAAALKALQDLVLTYWVDLGGNAGATMTTFNEMLAYQALEATTGVHIEFQHPPIGQGTEQFNLIIASGQYPDIIEHNWLNAPGGPAKYLSDGVIVRLNDLIDEHAPNLKALLEEHPEWRREIVTDEGALYSFPFIRGHPSLQVFQGPIIRQDWLTTLGLEVPETIDEWHTMLVAFKEGDPNGNGTADEVPFTSTLYNLPLEGFRLPHAFVGAWDIAMEFYQEDGVVKYGMLQPEFKEFLSVMSSWYAEGLYDPDFVTMDQALEDAKVTGNLLGSFIQNTGGGIGKYMSLMKDDPNFQLVAAPYPVLNKGDVPTFGQRDRAFPGLGAAITTSNSNVVEAVKWLDYAFGPEGHMLFNFGVEGTSYELEDGYPKYTDLVTASELPLSQSMARYFRSNFAGPFVQDARYMEQYAALPEQQHSLDVWSRPTNEKLMPPVTPTEDESRRYASIMNDINTLRDEAVVKIIVGQLSLDDWDTTVSQMQQIGIEDAIAIQQGALERFNAR